MSSNYRGGDSRYSSGSSYGSGSNPRGGDSGYNSTSSGSGRYGGDTARYDRGSGTSYRYDQRNGGSTSYGRGDGDSTRYNRGGGSGTSGSTGTTNVPITPPRNTGNKNLPAKRSWVSDLTSRLSDLAPEPVTHRASGSVSLTGKVVSFQTRQRRKDFLHVFFDTLINGAPMTFSPMVQVMTVELNENDYTQIDSDGRRSVVVNSMGRIYDGAIQVGDRVTLHGQWTTNHTINATKINNLSNGSQIVTSHSIPASIVRILTLALIVGIFLLFRNLGGSGAGTGSNTGSTATPGSSGGSGAGSDLLSYILLGAFLVWAFFGLNKWRVRRFFRKVLWIGAGIVLFYIMLNTMPDLLYSLLVLVLMLWGLKCMIKGSFR